jgi:hypothetical protein
MRSETAFRDITREFLGQNLFSGHGVCTFATPAVDLAGYNSVCLSWIFPSLSRLNPESEITLRLLHSDGAEGDFKAVPGIEMVGPIGHENVKDGVYKILKTAGDIEVWTLGEAIYSVGYIGAMGWLKGEITIHEYGKFYVQAYASKMQITNGIGTRNYPVEGGLV